MIHHLFQAITLLLNYNNTFCQLGYQFMSNIFINIDNISMTRLAIVPKGVTTDGQCSCEIK